MSKKPTTADAFEKLVADTAADISKLNSTHLMFYKRLGQRAESLVDAPESYGNRTVDMFCDSLNKISIAPVSKSTVYSCVRVWKRLGAAGYDKAIAANMAWRNLQFLGSDKLSDDACQTILEDISRGKLSQLQAKEAVHAAIGGGDGSGGGTGASSGNDANGDDTDPDKPGVKTAIRMIRNIPKLLDTVIDKIDGYADSVKIVVDANNLDDIRTASEHLQDLKEKLDVIQTNMTKQIEDAEKLLKKFKSK
jgi:hypothetical protein